jgi:hydroxybutyrate-dimer hydrolase
VLQAAQFGLAMLDRAYPQLAPFTAKNTRIIVTGISNGGGAALQAAGVDDEGLLAGVVALEPNVHAPGQGRALFDYATEAALLLPCALTDARFDAVPFARAPGTRFWPLRCASLHAHGLLPGDTSAQQAAQAYAQLRANGWNDAALQVAATTTAFDLWRAIAAAYASAYLRRGATDMPCHFRYAAIGAGGLPGVADPATRAAWWADGAGIPPGNGIGLYGGTDLSVDPTLPGALCLRALWNGNGVDAHALRAAVAATAVRLPRKSLPLWVLHGADDGLLPTAFTSDPYVAWLRREGRAPLYWKVPHAQHFDAFLPLPGFGERHVPLLPYGYAALDRLWAHLYERQPWPADLPTPAARPRGAGMLDRARLALP